MLYALSGLRKDVKLFCMNHELATINDVKRWGNVYDLCSEEKCVEANSTIDRLEKAIEKLQVRAISPSRSTGRLSPSPDRQVRFSDESNVDRPGQGRSWQARGVASSTRRHLHASRRIPEDHAATEGQVGFIPIVNRPPPPQSELCRSTGQRSQFEGPRSQRDDDSSQQRNIACRNCGRFHPWGACMARGSPV